MALNRIYFLFLLRERRITIMRLLRKLCEIQAPSGDESALKQFIVHYVRENQNNWVRKPEIIMGDDFQDCLILKFGKPRTAVYAHMDSTGFTVRYEDQLVPIGSPDVQTGYKLVGEDHLGPIECELVVDQHENLRYKFGRAIHRGTNLVFKTHFDESDEYIQSCYLDNRLGVYNCLKLAERLENGVLVFSCWEEHGGGSVPYLVKFLFEKYNIRQSIVSDITWVTDGIYPGQGVVISLRDRNIPRKHFVDKIVDVANKSGIDFQLEVEASGSSDGREIQSSPYPVDWCFIGAAEQNVHSPHEKVHKKDIQAMISLYERLLKEL